MNNIVKLAIVSLTSMTMWGCAQDSTNSVALHGGPLDSDTKFVAQPLGQSTRAVWFSGEGANTIPSYEERLAVHLLNRVRLSPSTWGIEDQDGNPVPANPPMRYEPFMAEAGRWQGKHALQYECFCPQEPDDESSWNSCCELGRVDGEVQCVGPVVTCDDELATDEETRWTLLNTGAGEIQAEAYVTGSEAPDGPDVVSGEIGAENALQMLLNFLLAPNYNALGIAQTNAPIVPEDCFYCDDDECKENQCNPDNFRKGFYWSYLMGRTLQLPPVLSDGIHAQLGRDTSGIFGETPENHVEFAVNYHEPAGEPEGIWVIVDGQCELLTRFADQDAAGADVGATFLTQLELGEGCHRYSFATIDAEGFAHTYPGYGSLAVHINATGEVISNSEVCPIWQSAPVSLSCLPATDACHASDTRACYTGRPGTQDKGICTMGTESCAANGWWSAKCEGDITPEPEENCEDALDNNCNGIINEGCPGGVPDTPGNEEEDDENNAEEPTEVDDEQSDAQAPLDTQNPDQGTGCGCNQAQTPLPLTAPLVILFFLLGSVALRAYQNRQKVV